MSKDEGDLWRSHKAERQKKKWSNYDKSKELIQRSGVEYTEYENGLFHIWDYNIWLTTGLFIHRPTGKKGRGIRNLLKKIGK